MSDPTTPLTFTQKVQLLLRVWITYLQVSARRNRPLPAQVQALTRKHGPKATHIPVAKVRRAIHLGLRAGKLTPRCLPNALVMFRILHEQGDDPVLVIGLPRVAENHIAHAWVELDGQDVGPPPGRGDHTELARFS